MPLSSDISDGLRGFARILADFPAQVREGFRTGERYTKALLPGKPHWILFCGMGGSAVAGDIMKIYLEEKARIPVIVTKSFELPGWIDRKGLVVALSYSGDTREVLSVCRQARERGLNMLCVTSGGAMRRFCEDNGVSYIGIPGGLPPRLALGYLFFPLLSYLIACGIVDRDDRGLEEMHGILSAIAGRNMGDEDGFERDYACKIKGYLPVIYSSYQLEGCAWRWKNQLNENAKVFSYVNFFPEVCHNEIEAWNLYDPFAENMIAVFLRDKNEPAWLCSRFEMAGCIIGSQSFRSITVYSEGTFFLSRIFSLIYAGDWVSYHLAEIREMDPGKIENIEFIKKRLKDEEESI